MSFNYTLAWIFKMSIYIKKRNELKSSNSNAILPSKSTSDFSILLYLQAQGQTSSKGIQIYDRTISKSFRLLKIVEPSYLHLAVPLLPPQHCPYSHKDLYHPTTFFYIIYFLESTEFSISFCTQNLSWL